MPLRLENARITSKSREPWVARLANGAVAINAGRAVLEASGGLTIERAREVGETGVDYISVGALTHSVKVFDIGMDLVEEAVARDGAKVGPRP